MNQFKSPAKQTKKKSMCSDIKMVLPFSKKKKRKKVKRYCPCGRCHMPTHPTEKEAETVENSDHIYFGYNQTPVLLS